MGIKQLLGNVDLTAIVAVFIAVATLLFPPVMAFLWILIAGLIQFEVWDKLKLWFYTQSLLAGKPGAAAGRLMLGSGELSKLKKD